MDLDPEYMLYDESNQKNFAIVDEATWKRIQTIAWNEDMSGSKDALLDCRHDCVNLYYSEDDRPEGQTFPIEDKSGKEAHSILKAVMIDQNIHLSIIVKNYAAYYEAKRLMRQSEDPEAELHKVKAAFDGTPEDWDWARKKFEILLDRANAGEGSQGCPIHKDFQKKTRQSRVGRGLLDERGKTDNDNGR